MATQYVPLETLTLIEGAELAHPTSLPELVYIEDPATHVMVDFQHEYPLVVDAHEMLTDLIKIIQGTHAHDVLVADHKNIIGIVSIRDLRGIKPAHICETANVSPAEITAQMLMTPIADIVIISYEDLLHTRVGNIVSTLNIHKKNYALVVEYNTNTSEQIIRGMILTSKLSEQLGQHLGRLA